MLQQYVVKKGFGRAKTKEFFIIQADGDTIGGFVAGPFENKEQGYGAIEALHSLYNRRLLLVGGHLFGWNWNWEWDWRTNGERLAEEETAGE